MQAVTAREDRTQQANFQAYGCFWSYKAAPATLRCAKNEQKKWHRAA